MNQRLKLLRKQFNLNQSDFALRIGVSQSAVAAWESGIRNPIDAIVQSICREFGVSESWLRTGDGPMLVAQSPDEQITAYVAKTLRGDNDFKKAVLSLLLSRTDEELAVIERAYHDLGTILKQREEQ
nr:MAG TPA: hypothetical protein [Bacteriophage sp.]